MKLFFLILYLLNSHTFVNNNNEYTSSNEQFYNITISKTELDNSPIEGSTFQLYKNDNIIRNDIKTDINGKAIISSLNNGEYILKETTELSWFKNSEDRIISINNDDKKINIKSKHIKPASINIINKDSMNNNITGSVFNVYKDDELVGENDTSGLFPGVYTVKQVQVNDIYKIDKNEYTIELKEGENKYLEIKNYKEYLNFNTPLIVFIISCLLVIKKIFL